MISLLTSKFRSLRWFIFFTILVSCLVVFLGTSIITSLHYENLMAQQAKNMLALPVTVDVRLAYILSFVFFSVIVMALAALISHLATRHIHLAVNEFQQEIKTIETAQDLRAFDARPEQFLFEELSDAFAGVNQLAQRLDSILVDKSLLQKALDLAEQEDRMAADILYGHLIEKNAESPLGIAHRIRSSSHFSGDIVLVRTAPSGSVFVLLADATGHGLSATITIMPIISVFDAMVKKGHELPFILREMNKRLLKDLPDDRFVAAILMEIRPGDQELRLWNGGMPRSLVLNPHRQLVTSLRSQHMALGILDDSLFDATTERLQLPAEGYLLCMSDGLAEQRSQTQEAFGEDRLLACLEQSQGKAVIPTLLEAVTQHAGKQVPDDDISMVVLDFERLNQHWAKHQTTSLQPPQLPSSAFQWQVRIQGEQLTNQNLPAIINDFLQALKLDAQLIHRIFNISLLLLDKSLNENLLQLAPQLRQQYLSREGEAGLQSYYQKRKEALCQLDEQAFLEFRIQNLPGQQQEDAKLQLDLIDNGQGTPSPFEARLLEEWQVKDAQLLAGGHHQRITL